MTAATALPRTFAAQTRGLLVLGLPLVGTQIAGYALHLTDTILLGWHSVISLAASTIATSILFNFWILGAGFGTAVMAMTAAAVGSGDGARARRVARMAMWLSLAYTVLTIWPLWNSERLLLAIGQKPEVAAEAQDFLRIAMWGMFPLLLQNVFRSYLAGHERTRVLLWVTLGAVVLNAVLASALIFGLWGMPALGIKGAALASLLVQVTTTLVLGTYATRALPQARLFQRIWRPDGRALRDVVRIGWPIGVTQLCEGSLFTGAAIMMGWIGAVELAAHGAAMQLASLTFMFHLGMSQAATIHAGGAFGRRDEADLRRTARAAIAVTLTFALLIVAVFVTIPSQLVSIFIDPTDPALPQLVAVGTTLVLMAALFQVVDAMQVVALSLLRGLQDTTVPMIMAIVSYWVIGMPVAYGFGFGLGWAEAGIWLGLTMGLAAAAVLLMLRFWRRAVRIGVADV